MVCFAPVFTDWLIGTFSPPNMCVSFKQRMEIMGGGMVLWGERSHAPHAPSFLSPRHRASLHSRTQKTGLSAISRSRLDRLSPSNSSEVQEDLSPTSGMHPDSFWLCCWSISLVFLWRLASFVFISHDSLKMRLPSFCPGSRLLSRLLVGVFYSSQLINHWSHL